MHYHLLACTLRREAEKSKWWGEGLLMLKRSKGDCSLKILNICSQSVCLSYEGENKGEGVDFCKAARWWPLERTHMMEEAPAPLSDHSDLSGYLMKPLCPQRDSSITPRPRAYKYLSHQTQKGTVTLFVSKKKREWMNVCAFMYACVCFDVFTFCLFRCLDFIL